MSSNRRRLHSARRRPSPARPFTALALAAGFALLACSGTYAATVIYSYNSSGQLYQAKYDNGTVVTYYYDLNGNRTGAVITPPSLTAPSGLAATSSSPTQINLTWTASSGATGYNIDRCQGSGCTSFAQIGSTTGTSYSNTGLSPSTTYVYEVQAYNSSNSTSPFSNAASAQTQGDTTPPTAPANLTASVSGSAIALTWSASSDNVMVAGYHLERCQGSGCASFAQIASPTGTSYSDSTAAPSVTYQYRVRAFDEVGNNSGYSNTASATLPDTTPPTVPTGLSASAASWSTVNLSWAASTDNVGVAGYRVYRNGSQIGTTGSTSYTDGSTAPSTTYSYTVSAYDAAGNNSAQSVAAGATTPAEPVPAAPTGLTGTPVADNQVNLSWSAASDAGGPGIGGYRVFRNGSQIGTTASTSFSDTGVSAFNSYTYTVQAYDTFGLSSSQSSVLSIYTAYEITDSNGSVIPAAASLYTSSTWTEYPQVNFWAVSQAYGSKSYVVIANTQAYSGQSACQYGTTQMVASGYQRNACVLYASPSAYGH